MANVNATSFDIQFIEMSTSCSKYIKSKHIDTVHVHKSEQDFLNKNYIKTQHSLYQNYYSVSSFKKLILSA